MSITLVQAHKINTLRSRGKSLREIAEAVGTSHITVRNILNGQYMVQVRAVADRMEVFLGGAVIGNGNVRFHAASPGATNDDGHVPSRAQHPIHAPLENGRLVPLDADVLSGLLAEEDLLERIDSAGLNADDVLLIDHEAGVEDGTATGGTRVLRDKDVHSETWEEFEARCKREAHGNWRAHMVKLLENEGAEVDVWSVRDPDFQGWGLPYHHIERSKTA